MEKIRFIGDIHGYISVWRDLIKDVPRSVQIGDFGIGFMNYRPIDLDQIADSSKHKFIKGNHDNPKECLKYSHWIPDGTIEDRTMYIGGAESIDKAHRTPDLDWWHEEELDHSQLEILKVVYGHHLPKIMITHDCPSSIADILSEIKGTGKTIHSRTRIMFERMFYSYQPEIWIFGHWHMSFDKKIAGTRFICLNINEYKDIEV